MKICISTIDLNREGKSEDVLHTDQFDNWIGVIPSLRRGDMVDYEDHTFHVTHQRVRLVKRPGNNLEVEEMEISLLRHKVGAEPR
jgi:hypothetical protein